MQLPGPLRAAVGLVATAAEEAKHLPDRAIELPMLAVSTALQLSLRAQQRYARYTARGDEALSRRRASDDPPPWATFDDDPTPSAEAAALLDDLFGAPGPGAGPAPERPDPVGPTRTPADPALALVQDRPPATPETAAPETSAAKTPAPKTPATKAPAKKAAATKKAATKSPAKKAAQAAPGTKAAARSNSSRADKTVSGPRHTAPSRFDTVGDGAGSTDAGSTDAESDPRTDG